MVRGQNLLLESFRLIYKPPSLVQQGLLPEDESFTGMHEFEVIQDLV